MSTANSAARGASRKPTHKRTIAYAATAVAAILVGVAAWRLLGNAAESAAPSTAPVDATRIAESTPRVASGAASGGAPRLDAAAPVPAIPFEESERPRGASSPPLLREGYGALSVRAVFIHDGSPAAGVRGWFLSETDRARDVDFAAEIPSVVSDKDGRFPTVAMPPPRAEFRTDRGTSQLLTFEAGTETRDDVRIPRGRNVVVRVETTDGEPIPDAEVWISTKRDRMDSPVGRTNGEGILEVAALGTSPFVAVRAAGFQCSESRTPTSAFRHGETLRFKLRPGGGALSGSARRADGTPAEGAVVTAWTDATQPDLSPQENVEVHVVPAYRTLVDGEGRFSFFSLSSGPCDVAVRATTTPTLFEKVDVPALGVKRVDYVLRRGSVVEGSVRDGFGAPLEGAVVRLFRLDRKDGDGVLKSATTGSDGAYRIEGVSPGTFDMTASHPAMGSTTSRAEVASDQATRVDFELDRSRVVSGRVVHRGGAPVETGYVTATSVATGRRQFTVLLGPGDDGAFVFRLEDASPVRLEYYGPALRKLVFIDDVLPGGPPYLIEVDMPRIDAYVSARIIDAAGVPVPDVVLSCGLPGEVSFDRTLFGSSIDGVATVGPMPAGVYGVRVLLLTSGGFIQLKNLGSREVVAGATTKLEDVVVETPGKLRAILLDPEGRPSAAPKVEVFRTEDGAPRRVAAWTTSDRTEALTAGSYVATFESRGPDFGPVVRRFAIQPGVETTIEVRLDAERDAVSVVDVRVVDARSGETENLETPADVRVTSDEWFDLPPKNLSIVREAGVRLPRGRFRLRAELLGGRFAETVVDVPHPSQPRLTVEIRVP